MFNVDGNTGVNRDMTREALDIILGMWAANEPFECTGKFWTVKYPEEMYGFLKPHIKPLQKSFPPIGVAGLSKGSDTLKLAGERGYIPMSPNPNPAYVAREAPVGLKRAKQNARRSAPAGVVLKSGRWAPAVLSDQNL